MASRPGLEGAFFGTFDSNTRPAIWIEGCNLFIHTPEGGAIKFLAPVSLAPL